MITLKPIVILKSKRRKSENDLLDFGVFDIYTSLSEGESIGDASCTSVYLEQGKSYFDIILIHLMFIFVL